MTQQNRALKTNNMRTIRNTPTNTVAAMFKPRLTHRQERAVNCFLSHHDSTIKEQPEFIQTLFLEGKAIAGRTRK